MHLFLQFLIGVENHVIVNAKSRNEDDEWAANKSVTQYHSISYAVDDQLFYTTWTEECASTQNDHLFVKHL